MPKIEVLSPVHIGTGNYYYSFTIHRNKRYNFETMLDTVYSKESLLNSNSLSKLSNDKIASQLSNKEFFNTFNININNIKTEEALYNLKMITDKAAKVHENMKTGGNLYIPGSTLKGYILNVAWYDIIEKNEYIKQFLLNEKMNPQKNTFKKVENDVKYIYQFLCVRDIMFDGKEPYVYFCNRLGYINKKTRQETKIPVGLIECLNTNQKVECEIIYGNEQNYLGSKTKQKIKNSIINNVDNITMKTIIEELYKRLTDLKSWFMEANKNYMLDNIKDEIDFIKDVDNSLLDKNTIINFYNKIRVNLNNNELIIRLGKFTNYQEKSIGKAFKSDYEKHFKDYFSPKPTKKTPGIRTMNILLDQTGNYNVIPGYIRLEL